MKYDVFISYSRKDYVDEQKNEIPGNVVSVIKDTFNQHGITYWMDEEGNLSGKKFAQVIASKIRESMVFLFVCTKNSVESEWVDMELSVAVERKKRIIPFVCDDSYKDDRVIMFTASHDRIEYFVHSEKELEKLVAAIEKDKKELEQKIQEAELQKQAEEEKRKKEEQRRIDEQKRTVNDIKIACNNLNIEETKLLAERDNLLLKTENVTDTEERAALKKDIQESSPISQKFQEERLGLVKEIEELKESVRIKDEENKNGLLQKDEQIAKLEKELEHAKNKTQSKPEIQIVEKPVTKRFHVLYILSILAVALLSLFWIVKDEKELAPYRQAKQEEEARQEAKRLAEARGEFTVNGVFFKMIPIEGGIFQMGSEAGDSNEKPVHEVKVDSFYIGETEVTQELWTAVMGMNPSYFKGDKLPVERVSWNDCQTFINKLNNLTGQKFRLPTEAEWEFAARGGTTTSLYNGEDFIIQGLYNSPNLDKLAWYGGNCGQNYTASAGCDMANGYYISGWSEKQYADSMGGTHPVGLKQPNAYGLYDILGNVWEWCQDWYRSDYYSFSSSVVNNPTGPSSGSNRVFRGGSWNDYAKNCRVANRGNNTPTITYNSVGFRLAL